MHWASVAAGLALLLVTPGTAGAAARQEAPTNPLAQATARQVEDVMADGTPGVALLVRGATTTQRIAAGRSRLSPERPLGTTETFRAGSVTKSFVAAAILRQIDEGNLRLSDTVERWLPKLVPSGKRITVRHLLGQTSGLADYTSDPAIIGPVDADPSYRYSLATLASAAAKLPPTGKPGKQFAYSNTNYVLLGRILEKVTGRTWTRELRASILRPLKLKATTMPATERVREPFVHGYVAGPGEALVEATVYNPSFTGSAGMLSSTLDDLAAFYRGLLGGVLVGPRSLAAMQRLPAISTVGRFRYGLGLMRLRTRCGLVWGHDGELLGTSTLAFSSPHGEKQVVAVFNRGQPTPSQASARLALVEQAYCADLGA